MRTKTLLLTAATGLAAMLTVSAQVYSVNVVGYVNVQCTAGFNLIANPLNNTTGNDLNKILALTDADIGGATVYRYVQGTGFVESTWLGTASGWLPNATLAPGEGFFVSLASAKTLTFVGEVLQDAASNMTIPAGLSLVGSKVPQSAKLEDMGFPGVIGDTTVYFYRGTPKTYVESTFVGTWIPDAIPGVGEGFWVSTLSAKNWNRNFKVN